MMGSFFRFSDRREDTFVAGLSMGGYGALKLALRHPDRFAAAASLSGAVDVAALAERPERRELFDRVFDGEPAPDEDLFALLAEADVRPPCRRCTSRCGTEDPLYPLSVRFADEAVGAGAKVTTDFRPGEHEWGLWDDGHPRRHRLARLG